MRIVGIIDNIDGNPDFSTACRGCDCTYFETVVHYLEPLVVYDFPAAARDSILLNMFRVDVVTTCSESLFQHSMIRFVKKCLRISLALSCSPSDYYYLKGT